MRFDRYYSFLGFKTFILFLYLEYCRVFIGFMVFIYVKLFVIAYDLIVLIWKLPENYLPLPYKIRATI